MFGGANIGGKTTSNQNGVVFFDDTWFLSIGNETNENRTVVEVAIWEEVLKGANTWPKARMDHAMESMGENKVLLYGGCSGDTFHTSCVKFFDDLWMVSERSKEFLLLLLFCMKLTYKKFMIMNDYFEFFFKFSFHDSSSLQMVNKVHGSQFKQVLKEREQNIPWHISKNQC